MDTSASTPVASTRASLQLSFLLVGVVAVVAAIFAAASLYDAWYALFKTVHVTFALIWMAVVSC